MNKFPHYPPPPLLHSNKMNQFPNYPPPPPPHHPRPHHPNPNPSPSPNPPLDPYSNRNPNHPQRPHPHPSSNPNPNPNPNHPHHPYPHPHHPHPQRSHPHPSSNPNPNPNPNHPHHPYPSNPNHPHHPYPSNPNHPIPQRPYPNPNPNHPIPQLPYPNPNPNPRNRRPPKQKAGESTIASCIVATIFLLFIIIILSIIYFSLFKPKDPKITVTFIQLPSFSLSSNATAVSFTFSLYATVRNPNRAVFSHFDSSLQLLYAGNQIGFMFIPAGLIDSQETKFLTASFSVQSFPVSTFPAAMDSSEKVDRVSPMMEIEARMEMVGRVRVLWFFSHHVNDVSDCRVAVAVIDGSVLGFRC